MPELAAGTGFARAPWGVAALVLAAHDALAARFGAVAVRGELSGFARAGSGHCYFSLKDADGAPALLRCAMFRRAASLLDFAPADGMQVELRGRLGVYEARGELQLVVESMQRLGAGALYEEFLRRRARLAAEGLFDAARKRAVPAWPQALGVVTSPNAAALQDVLAALARRAPQVRVVVYPAPVQGADAPPLLVAALAEAARRREVDTLLLVRGGGSLEDLWAFNDERLVRAIATSPLPLICGVGHETDVTLADLAADLRAPTPTAAAELAAPAQAEALAQLQTRQEGLARALERVLQRQAQRLDSLGLRLGSPARRLATEHELLELRRQRLQRALRALWPREQERLRQLAVLAAQGLRLRLQAEPLRLAAAAARLQAQDPRRVLRRGYAWIERADGRPVGSVAGLQSGESLRATWADGRASVVVDRIEPGAPTLDPTLTATQAPGAAGEA
jgi:exodeoxyribonuclease VII large subunit